MPDRSQPLYDTATFDTTAGVTHQLFNTQENADTSHPTDITNMKGNGSLPDKDSMRIEKIGVYADQEIVVADLQLVWTGNYIRIKVGQREVLVLPLTLAAMMDSWSGSIELASAAANTAIGRQGMGYDLDIPIIVPGGTQLVVEVYQKTALSASGLVKVVLDGVYSFGGD